MHKNSMLAGFLTAFLIGTTLVGLAASGLPYHLVEGGVFGPGGDKSPGSSNPANAVGMVFYSTSQPSYAIINGPDSFTPADGTDPAVYARDVGNVWDWQDGDETVVVFETLRGATWTGVNYTSSVTATLHTGAAAEDIGNATLERLPALTVNAGFDWSNVTWPALTDTANNVRLYTLYQASSPAGPFIAIANLTHSPGLKYVNQTGFSPRQLCYQLTVKYRRDNVGGLYETNGRSETTCGFVTGTVPTIIAKDPGDNAVNVPLDKSIVVTFSESMNTLSVTAQIFPLVALTSAWSAGGTVLNLSHTTSFTICQPYTVSISGKDLDGNSLAPNPTSWTFTALCNLPFIVTTSPSNGTRGVRLTEPIVITFSEPMNTGTVTYPIVPSLALSPGWTVSNTVLTLTHASAFVAGTSYELTIGGDDLDGNPLIAGPAPNPLNFSANNPPTASIDPSDTLVNRCCDGGYGLLIPWTMDDVETPLGQLRVWLNYTNATGGGAIAGPLTGRTSPDAVNWTTPLFNGPLTIWLEVMDAAGDSAQDSSASVTIDSIAPIVEDVNPSNGAVNVPTDSLVTVAFSEPMRTATVNVTFTPSVANLQLIWDSTNMNVTVTHPDFQANFSYVLTVAATARDACTPGNQMGTANVTSFTTGAGHKTPEPPKNLTVSSKSYNQAVLTWTPPSFYTDGSPLPVQEITMYRIYRAISLTGGKSVVGNSTTATFTDTGVEQQQTYFWWVTAVDSTGMESDFSNYATATIPQKTEEAGFSWLWIIIIVIIVLIVVGLILLLKGRKPKEAEAPQPIPGEAPLEEPPAGETPPVDESPPKVEAPPEEEPEVGAGGQQTH